jgi:hypothetical protein
MQLMRYANMDFSLEAQRPSGAYCAATPSLMAALITPEKRK